jgi:biopolymer transport protein ExbD
MAIVIEGAKGPEGDINVTPLIDIVLVMLIIFMVLTPIVIEEMAVNLPEQTEVVPQEDLPRDQLLVAVYDDGTVALNKKIMPMVDLRAALATRLKAKSKRVVFVDGHPDAPYGFMVKAIDMVRDAGADRIGLAKMKDEGPARLGDVPPVQGAEGEGAAVEGEPPPAAEG